MFFFFSPLHILGELVETFSRKAGRNTFESHPTNGEHGELMTVLLRN